MLHGRVSDECVPFEFVRVFCEFGEVRYTEEGVASGEGTGIPHERSKHRISTSGPPADSRALWIDKTLLAKQFHGSDAVVYVHYSPVTPQALAIAFSVSG